MKGLVLALAFLAVAVSGHNSRRTEPDVVKAEGICFEFLEYLRENKTGNTNAVATFCAEHDVETWKCIRLTMGEKLFLFGIRKGLSNEEICAVLRNIPVFNKKVMVNKKMGPLCSACGVIVEFVKFGIKELNRTEEYIKTLLQKICDWQSFQVQKKMCLYILDKIDLVVKLINEEMQPGEICKTLGFCKNDTKLDDKSHGCHGSHRRHGHHRHHGHGEDDTKRHAHRNHTCHYHHKERKGPLGHWFSNLKAKFLPMIKIKLAHKGMYWKKIVHLLKKGMTGRGFHLHKIHYEAPPCFHRRCFLERTKLKRKIKEHACRKCRIITGVLHRRLHVLNETKGSVVRVMEGLCKRFPPRLRISLCGHAKKGKNKIINAVLAELHSGQVCNKMGFCTQRGNKTIPHHKNAVGKKMEGMTNTMCSFCNMLNKTFANVKDAVTSMANKVTLAIDDFCNAAKDLRGGIIQCISMRKMIESQMTVMTSSGLPSVCSNLTCPDQSTPKSFPKGGGGRGCQMCRMYEKTNVMQMEMTRNSLGQVLGNTGLMCNSLPSPLKEKCTRMFDVLKSSMTEVWDKVNPKGICVKFKICPNTTEQDEKDKKGANGKERYLRKFRSEVAKGKPRVSCYLCQLTVKFLRRRVFERKPFNETTSAVMEAYGSTLGLSQAATIMTNVEVFLKPTTMNTPALVVCKQLHLCTPRGRGRGRQGGRGHGRQGGRGHGRHGR